MRDMLLINANNLGTYRSARVMAESLGIAVLKAVLDANGYACDIADARLYDLSPQQAAGRAAEYHCVGISMFSFEAFPWVREAVHICKLARPDVRVFLGGYCPSLLPEHMLELLPELDGVMRGEGEVTILELLRALDAQSGLENVRGIVYREGDTVRKNPQRELISDLDALPFPVRYAQEFADENFEILIEGGRGCMNNCTFCAVKPFFKNAAHIHWRGRSAQSLIDEIKEIRKVYPKPRRIRFVDPDFLGSDPQGLERALEFCRLLKENRIEGYRFYIETRSVTVSEKNAHVFRALKEAGFVEIYLGFESGSPYILKTMNKKIAPEDSVEAARRLRKWGIDFVYGFMMLTPWSSMEDIRCNIEFLKKVGDIQFDKLFHRLDLIPGTPSVRIAEKKQLLGDLNERGYYDYRFAHREAENISEVWPYLQKYHMPFLLEIWYCYKDLKTWSQWDAAGAKQPLEQLSRISLELFARLCSCVEDGCGIDPDRGRAIGEIIAEYTEKLKEIQALVNPKYCFPRNKMPGGA